VVKKCRRVAAFEGIVKPRLDSDALGSNPDTSGVRSPRFDPSAVTQRGPGSFHVAIAGVRDDTGTVGTVECAVEGRVGGVVLADWSRHAG
jgi:hypothetical protein